MWNVGSWAYNAASVGFGIGFAALAYSIAAFFQDLIPASVWEQIPVIVLFCVVFILISRYFFQFEAKRTEAQTTESERWRQLLQVERERFVEALAQALSSQRESWVTLLQMAQTSNKDLFAAFSKAQSEAFRDVFDEAVRYISEKDALSGRSERTGQAPRQTNQ